MAKFLKDFYAKRYVLFQLVKRDIFYRYAGSNLGFLWNIVQPLMMILVLWIVFSFAFRTPTVDTEVPFVIWLVCGLIAWNFFSDALLNISNVFFEYSFLVKKIQFKIVFLPFVKLISSFFTHLVFVVICFAILIAYGFSFQISYLQIFYYTFAMLFLLTGVGLIFATAKVFVRDTTQIISIILQFGFWLTPIVWNMSIVPQKYFFIMFLNPVAYVVQGYRDSFIYGKWFWEEPWQTVYFWSFSVIVLIVGVKLFRESKNYFADVL